MTRRSVILFYTPFSNRSRDTESLILAFRQQGHRVISLCQTQGHFFHEFLASQGIETFSYVLNGPANLWYYFRHLVHFVWFCWKFKVDVVYSHLESSSLVSVFGQYFVPSRVFVCRHHADMFSFTKSRPGFAYRLTYWLARRIIVVSNAAKNYMILEENVSERKISVIRLAFDFNLYPVVNESFVNKIRRDHPSTLTLITVGQLIPIKRPNISILVLKRVVELGIDANLIMAGRGGMENECRKLAQDIGIADKVIFTGYVENVLDFIASSTVLLHPSISESSCIVIKEAGLVDKPVIACAGVGDFDDFIENKKNGFLVDPDNFVEEAVSIINDYYRNNTFSLKQSLRSDILRLFSVASVLPFYDQLNSR